MKQRVITAVVALIIFIPLLIVGGFAFNILVIAMGLVATSEFLRMRKKLLISTEAILSFLAMASLLIPIKWLDFVPEQMTNIGMFYFFVMCLLLYTVVSKNRFSFDDAGVLTLGMIYAGFGFNYMMAARENGLWILLYALLIVWITDSGAYMIGRKLGKHKLAPHISPNKTWEGSIGGTVVAVVLVGIYMYFFPQVQLYDYLTMLILTLLFSIGGQFGDLVESAFKRHYRVKDSGNILPGHGGILDRFDSLLFVLPLMHFAGII
ncbi:phosphatidate cytidylyltransferase [Ligilactobacillus sp. WILCCON 0076]|uniref:Phosphatidate cytidylyltransferase n=1 Tax=Ligilactobacillus ubinensis TaxID=2876789 RepID=A0A9X2JK76_9LACO|nr:phosphatidate cytidylyltransferase [Ligilactobacillus ubinensis]MCP0886033.1 phosphatidate cytidylyltransferase [Ligilactobacillus ubinensis]